MKALRREIALAIVLSICFVFGRSVDKLDPSSKGSSRGALWRETCLSVRCGKSEVHAAIVCALRCNELSLSAPEALKQ